MGARIAAHLANAGFAVELLDRVLPEGRERNGAALGGLENAARQRPVAFFTEGARGLIRPGNFEDDLGRVRQCEWIIEAVAEDLEIKRALWRRVAAVRRPGTIVSTNTSGIALGRICEGFDGEFRAHFLGTHFFNPPRYLHLMEAIAGAETRGEVLERVAWFCDVHLGKGVVRCKDTPNFIANRMGCFFGGKVWQLAEAGGFTVEEVDALTGPLIGLPKSASFRLLDVIGLDVWVRILRNLHEAAPLDPARELYRIPPAMERMLERGWLGEKRGQGFYRRVGKGAEQGIWALDRETLEYRPARKANFPAVEAVRGIEDVGERLRRLVAGGGRAGEFLWKLWRDFVLHAARMVPEITDRIVEIDRAMRWGYGFTLGPFEAWDALGVGETVDRMRREGCAIPGNVEGMLGSGAAGFYGVEGAGESGACYFDLGSGVYAPLEKRSGVLLLSECRRAGGVVKTGADASLVDLGDGVLCLEFHGKGNRTGEDVVRMAGLALEEMERGFEALVVAHDGENFSLGGDLGRVLGAAQAGRWDELDGEIRRFQAVCMAMKYAARPVVAAPCGMTLGGGCEMVLHCGRVQAAAETYMGLTETGVGLIPAGGGCKELLMRLGSARDAFERIGGGKVSQSAGQAREWGFVRPGDGITMNRERLTADAKRVALGEVAGWAPGAPRQDIAVEGEAGYAALKMQMTLAAEGGYLTEYDCVVGEKLARVLCGGRLTGRQRVTEGYLLDLEREAFLSLCGNGKTQERMRYMVKNGRAPRN